MRDGTLAPASILFAIFLGGLAALPPISIDMALPALGEIGDTLHATRSAAGFTLSLFMAGFVIGPLVYGPLSDAYGRKPLLFLGLVIFTVGGVLAACAPSICVLLLARFVQGLGAGSGMTIALAIVRDLFEGEAMQRRIGSITVVANVAPIVAPSLGVALLAVIHWRGIYGVMAGCGLVAALVTWRGLRESARIATTRFSMTKLVHNYATVLRHRDAAGAIVINGLGFGWMFAYVAGSPLVLLGTLHVRPLVYAAMFATTGAGIVAGAALNGVLARRGVSSGRLLFVAIAFAAISSVGLIALASLRCITLCTAMPLFLVSSFCFGLAAPSAARRALDPLPELAGAAGGLLTSVQMLSGAVTSSLVAVLFPRFGVIGMSGVMAVCAISAMIVTRISCRRSSARR
ncbi:multidrug effflux MFS transporter [Caballeronia grimmiae]|uniref:Bcr/CflA family efflux transporter n=4 Tax=Caballeronia grimmiae TaxID=1071679 RepID=A0ABQ1RKU0_9BURK|nr:multidrug effflux MFS transporter [Caballeronia grimmiae]GGD70286.1 Bcr/CflA family drug resistance efflux transporter [Caballeronia grimmiae]